MPQAFRMVLVRHNATPGLALSAAMIELSSPPAIIDPSELSDPLSL
jgi:hypothetical protein